ncbi:MAG: RluA family pseudouridine synthase [Acidobacteriota bacterium]|nr:RluA family pseudouridine synthase [Acidobacteriota bacterium]
MTENLQFKIGETIKRNRLDKFLFEQITSVSKMYLRNLIERDECSVNGEIKPAGYHLLADDVVEIKVNSAVQTAMTPEALPLEIVFEDEEIIVVDKPAEMLVHPTLGQKNGTLLNALSYYLNVENAAQNQLANNSPKLKFIRPVLIHRLDRQTSGLMVIAKTARAARILSSHFQKKLVEKKYLTVVQGNVSEDSGTIDAPIGRFAEEKIWNVKADGKTAKTSFRVVQRFSGKTLLELEPITGRTNQLRIHCAYFGHPIIGDVKYGGLEFSRLCLHAAKLNFYHPRENKRMEFASEIPSQLQSLLEK